MKRFLFTVSILAMTTLPAAAQSWTGGYVGGAAGYGWGPSSQTDPGVPQPLTPTIPEEGPPEDGHYNTSGGMVGGTLGYNWQNGIWVFGVESDLSWADLKGQSGRPRKPGTRPVARSTG